MENGTAKPKLYEARSKNLPGLQWLIFNCHETDKRKARAVFIDRFGRDKYMEIIRPIERAGIMSIFNDKPNPYTALYVNVMAESVDKRALRREKKEASAANG